MRILRDLLKRTHVVSQVGDTMKEISGIKIDSREVTQGDLFIAVKGTQVDGHHYIEQAIKNGAVAIVCENIPTVTTKEVTYISVKESGHEVGKVATMFNGDPTSTLQLVGVTGTNGKTTIATCLYETFRKLGYKVGLISTVCNYIDGEAIPTEHTTPDAITLNVLLGRMATAGCTHVFMEVSSHAIDQDRIIGLTFAGGIFTNLTRDHLDYHKTLENYLKAKKRFFDNLPKQAFCLVNIDDKNGMVMAQNTAAKVASYSLSQLSDFKGKVIETHFDGTLLEINNRELAVQFVGKFNASNLLAVVGAATLLGEDFEEVLRVTSTLSPVDGRLQTFISPRKYAAIVDYAHTPDALANVLSAIHEVQQNKGAILTVVGAGGNRDKGKRPLMALEAIKGSTRVIITSDNPRFENPDEIIRDMIAELTDTQKKQILCITNRAEAIKTACLLAQEKDVVLIAGKGHETYQDIEGVKHHFDDREVVKEIFSNE
ncbi:MAG: UDP-N-acetylmuramoyl-L-alanyl-D-glutamate--2,6-diaminopimelate ligase [Bacteroidaceae bacterium]|nr:UDP-N-acetylmuramoyl-L-alanyl-D-glutamate--2,6-diaminopimelate ligase [Bacteroidaceae bacterium]